MSKTHLSDRRSKTHLLDKTSSPPSVVVSNGWEQADQGFTVQLPRSALDISIQFEGYRVWFRPEALVGVLCGAIHSRPTLPLARYTSPKSALRRILKSPPFGTLVQTAADEGIDGSCQTSLADLVAHVYANPGAALWLHGSSSFGACALLSAPKTHANRSSPCFSEEGRECQWQSLFYGGEEEKEGG